MKALINNQTYTTWQQVVPFLEGTGVHWETWDITQLPPNQLHKAHTVLSLLKHPLEIFKQTHHYQTEDVVCLTPNTENLEEKLAAFKAPHYHTDDEVRLTLAGQGVFTIYPTPNHPAVEITVEAGDMLIVPANTMHAFWLTPLQTITTVRIFKQNPKWQAIYEWPPNLTTTA